MTALLFIFLLAFPFLAQSQTLVFDESYVDNCQISSDACILNDPSLWIPSQVPDANTTLVISSSTPIQLYVPSNASLSISQINLAGNATLSVSGSLTVTYLMLEDISYTTVQGSLSAAQVTLNDDSHLQGPNASFTITQLNVGESTFFFAGSSNNINTMIVLGAMYISATNVTGNLQLFGVLNVYGTGMIFGNVSMANESMLYIPISQSSFLTVNGTFNAAGTLTTAIQDNDSVEYLDMAVITAWLINGNFTTLKTFDVNNQEVPVAITYKIEQNTVYLVHTTPLTLKKMVPVILLGGIPALLLAIVVVFSILKGGCDYAPEKPTTSV